VYVSVTDQIIRAARLSNQIRWLVGLSPRAVQRSGIASIVSRLSVPARAAR
jgi:hypothetical protein